jgi:hypothetical protein
MKKLTSRLEKATATGKSKKLESDFQAEVLSYLKNQIGGWWKKIHTGTYSRRGTPDIFGVKDGIAYVLEVKLPDGTGKVSSLQQKNMQEVRENGGVAMKIENMNEIKKLFDT